MKTFAAFLAAVFIFFEIPVHHAVSQTPHTIPVNKTATQATTKAPVVAQMKTAPAKAPSSPSGIRPVASVMQIMNTMVIPSSEVVFDAGGNPPKSDTEWEKVQNNAL